MQEEVCHLVEGAFLSQFADRVATIDQAVADSRDGRLAGDDAFQSGRVNFGCAHQKPRVFFSSCMEERNGTYGTHGTHRSHKSHRSHSSALKRKTVPSRSLEERPVAFFIAAVI